MLAKLLASVGSIRVRIESMWWWWVSLSCHKPWRTVICITVSLVVTWHYVQENPVFHVRAQIWKTASNSWKHSPTKKSKCHFDCSLKSVGHCIINMWLSFFFWLSPKFVVSQWKIFLSTTCSTVQSCTPWNEVANFSSASIHANTKKIYEWANQRFIYLCQILHATTFTINRETVN